MDALIPNDIQFFPNPGNGVFNIQVKGAFNDDIFLSLYTLMGTKVADQVIAKGDYDKSIPLSHLPLTPGIYFYHWKSGDKMGKGKLEVISN
jgi:hypothetical protein